MEIGSLKRLYRYGLEYPHQELRRTEQLVEIGAACRQELEQVRAKHTTHATDVQNVSDRQVVLCRESERSRKIRRAGGASRQRERRRSGDPGRPRGGRCRGHREIAFACGMNMLRGTVVVQ